MKLFLSIVLVLAASIAAAAQCDLTLKDAPVVRGMKFGMTQSEVTALFGKPLQTLDTDRNSWYYNPTMQQTAVRGLDGIMLLQIQFTGDKLYDINVNYNPQVSWKDAREFSQVISSNLNLPPMGWTYDRYDERRATMKCKDFTVEIDTRGYGQLHVQDLVAVKQKAEDLKSKDAEWKKAFKP
jgi:outer membrane protein assembly factor BamE (lipoprotein component of BamABCDE complex)